MRLIARILAMLCVIHVLALLALAVWLVATERMTPDRWQIVVEVFSRTAEQERLDLEQAQTVEQDAAAIAEQAVPTPSISAAEQIETARLADARQRRLADLARQEIQTLQQNLRVAMARFEEQKKQFDLERAEFDQRLAAAAKQADDEGFKKTVRLYESLPADQVKQMFLTMIQQNQTDQVVEYLRSMQPRAAANVLRAFEAPQEVQHAVDLTQRLRRIGSDSLKPAENLG